MLVVAKKSKKNGSSESMLNNIRGVFHVLQYQTVYIDIGFDL